MGDGIADFIMVELILRYYNWTIKDWKTNTYTSLPTKQVKVTVKILYTKAGLFQWR